MKSIIYRVVVSFLCVFSANATVPEGWPLSYPVWWSERDVLTDHNADPGNTSPINQGQLLHLAEQAIAELEAQLAPVGGAKIEFDSFLDTDDSSYYSPANLGQLKHVSSKFYERFAQFGLKPLVPDSDNPGQLIPITLTAEQIDGNLSGIQVYPWADSLTPDNFAIANIGQAKHLFSWDLSYLWSGEGFIIIESWPIDSSTQSNGVLDRQVIVYLMDANGFPMSNHLIRLNVESGPFEILDQSEHMTMTTNAQGRIDASLVLQDFYEGIGSLRVTAGLGDNAPYITLPISVLSSDAPPVPIVESTEVSTDGHVTIAWAGVEEDEGSAVRYEVIRDDVVIAVTTELEYVDELSSGWEQATYQLVSVDLTGVRSELSDPFILRELPISGVASPKSIEVVSNRGIEATISWIAGASDSGIAAYHILIDGVIVATSPTNSWTFTDLTASTNYTVSVVAVDQRGQASSVSESVTFTTSAAPLLNLEAGGAQGYFFESDGILRSFGRNDIYTLGARYPYDPLGLGAAQETPVSSSFNSNVSSLAAGSLSSVLLDSNSIVSQIGLYKIDSPQQASLFRLPDFGDATIGAIGCGLYHFMAIDAATGEVYSWGQNIDRQLGYSTTNLSESLIPSRVLLSNGITPLSGVKAVSGGNGFSVALMDDNTLKTWGHHLLVGRSSPNTAPQPPGSVTPYYSSSTIPAMISISAGVYHTLALSTSGQVWSFGYNSDGQTGLGAAAHIGTAYAALPVSKNSNFNDWFQDAVQIAAGGYHSLVLDDDGVVWSFGSNEFGQLGRTGDAWARKVTALSGIDIVSIAASASSSYAYASDGSLWAWGRNNYGQLGDGTTTDRSVPTRILTGVPHLVFTPYREGPSASSGLFISASRIGSTLRYTLDGTEVSSSSSVVSPGVAIYPAPGAQVRARAYQGDIALGEEQRWRMPTILGGAAGDAIAAHINASGSLAVWGRSIDFVPGRAAGVGQPLGELSDKKVRSVQISGTTAQALTYDGELYGWGDNAEGQLLSGGASRLLVPTREPLLFGQTIRSSAISSLNETGFGGAHRLILGDDGITSSGINNKGQLGLVSGPSPFRSFTEVELSELIYPIERVYAGTGVSFAQDISGNTLAWGDSNFVGFSEELILRDGGQMPSEFGPFRVAVSNLVQMCSSVLRTNGLRSDGTVWWWGIDSVTNTISPIPSQIRTASASLEDIISIDSGYNHTLALRADGTVWSWGNSSEGALGYPTVGDQIARQVPSVANIHWIAAGKEFSMAGDLAGNVWAWGRNTYGELGDISLPGGVSPVLVSIPEISPLVTPTEDFYEPPQGSESYIPPSLPDPDPSPSVGPIITIEAPYDLQAI